MHEPSEYNLAPNASSGTRVVYAGQRIQERLEQSMHTIVSSPTNVMSDSIAMNYRSIFSTKSWAIVKKVDKARDGITRKL